MGKFITLGGYNTRLTGKLPAKDRFLPIAREHTTRLLELLEWGDYTHMLMSDGLVAEAVKVENYCGRILLTRGIEGTKSVSFRCGACLEFIMTPAGVRDLVCQGYECIELADLPCEDCEEL